jgi:class 3 adenylate cyclase
MDRIQTRYARTPDGVYLGYQITGDGPIDLVWQPDWPGNIDMEREFRVVREYLDALSFYATFDGPARGIRCALEVAERVRDLGIEVRAGLHTGECRVIDGKVGGVAVSIGARIAATAGESEVRVSQTVKDLVAGSGFAFDHAGEHELKGVPDRWHVYRVVRG